MKRLVFTGSLLLALGVAQSQAADMTYPVAEESSQVEYGSGWYLRGDVGFSIGNQMKDGSATTSAGSSRDYVFDDVLDFSVGVGYNLNETFRLEGTIERSLSANATVTSSIETANCPTMELLDPDLPRSSGLASDCLSTDAMKYDSTLLMINGYYDLPKFGKLEPYFGGGIGIARFDWELKSGAVTCVPVDISVYPAACLAEGLAQPKDGEITSFGGQSSSGVDYQFAYAFSAGFGYRFTDNMLFDANYRYLSTGAVDINCSCEGSQIELGDNGTHQLRVGLRYEIW